MISSAAKIVVCLLSLAVMPCRSFADGELPGRAVPPACAPAEAPDTHCGVPCMCPRCESRWKLLITPYGWCTSVKGSVTVKGNATALNASFWDILDALDYGGMGQVELQRGRFMLIADSFYSKLSVGVSAQQTVIGPLSQFEKLVELSAQIDMKLWIQELVAGYRLYEGRVGCNPECGKLSLDALFGARYYMLGTDLRAQGRVTVTGPEGGRRSVERSRTISAETDWTDPVFGARLKYELTPKLGLSLRGDVGGSGSNASWSLAALADYRVTKRLSLIGGYKVLDMSHSMGDVAMDMRMEGPVVGMTYRMSF